MTIGWMIVATMPNGRTKAMPLGPEALDVLPTYLHGTLPTLGGAWKLESEAKDAWGKIPNEMRGYFNVVPVSITVLNSDL